jgi:hypothetical protein
MNNSEFPLLKGFLLPYKGEESKESCLIIVYCSFCKQFHLHGWKVGEFRPTHKAQHCIKENSPYTHGYTIAPFNKKERKMIKEMLDNEELYTLQKADHV